MDAELKALLRCPRCTSDLSWTDDIARCANKSCSYSREDFPGTNGQPVLIDFDDSIFQRHAYASGPGGAEISRSNGPPNLKARLKSILAGRNRQAEAKARDIVERARRLRSQPHILVIGGGSIGSGAEFLYGDIDARRIGTDVYASAHTDFLCDAHHLPFADESIDAVWIQAVLEHVLSPTQVAEEIRRVLRPGGLVYADTPFMQQVHEKAYDFTRFTLSGQRWLFRHFEQLDAGAVGGAGTALLSSIRYFVRALSGSDKLATLFALPFFWLRLFDGLGKARPNIDAASGTYFFGRKSEQPLKPSQMPSYYESQAGNGLRPSQHA